MKNRLKSAAWPADVGSLAPQFTLRSTADQSVSLSELRGKRVILVFYPADWSPVCGDQVALYNELLQEFQKYDAQLIGISVDGVWCHSAFARSLNLHFPLLADFEPKGAVSRLYNVYEPVAGVSKRALILIDEDGVVRWRYISPMGVNPGADGILEALQRVRGRQKEDAQ